MPETSVSGLPALASLLLPAGLSLLVVAGLVLLFRRRLHLTVPACLALAGSGLLWLAHGGGADGRAQGAQVPKIIHCEDREEHTPWTEPGDCLSGQGEEQEK